MPHGTEREPIDPHGFDQVIDPSGRRPRHVTLADHAASACSARRRGTNMNSAEYTPRRSFATANSIVPPQHADRSDLVIGLI
jgi:hypothetical protein